MIELLAKMISPAKRRFFEFKASFPKPWTVLIGHSCPLPDLYQSARVGFKKRNDGKLPFEDENIRLHVQTMVGETKSLFFSVKREGDGLLTFLLCLLGNLEVLRVSGSGSARVTVDLEEFQYWFGIEARKLKQRLSDESMYLHELACIHRHFGLSEEDWRDM